MDQASSLRTDLGELANTKDGLALISQQKHLVIINNKLYVRAKPPGNAMETKSYTITGSRKILVAKYAFKSKKLQ